MHMDFSDVDRAAQDLNEIIWRSVKGANFANACTGAALFVYQRVESGNPLNWKPYVC